MKHQFLYQPPGWARRFFIWYCRPEYLEDLLGDLEEEAQERFLFSQNRRRVNRWFIWQVCLLFKPRFVRPLFGQIFSKTQKLMFSNYLKFSIRNMQKHKSSALINIAGLTLGMACFLLIGMYVLDELSYDRHFREADQVYRVTVKNYNAEGNVSRHWAFASAGHAERLKADYAQISHATRFFPWAFPDLTYGEKFLPAEQVVFTDNDVFDIFSFEFAEGNPQTALEDIYSLVLTEASAVRLFGNDWQDQSILGETVKLSRDGLEAPFKVTAVLKDMPEQQHFHFEYLAPIRFISQLFGEEAMQNVGGNYNWLTYVKIAPETDLPNLTASVNEQFWDKYIGQLRSGRSAKDFYDIQFQPMLDVHLKSNLEGEIEPNGSLEQIKIFSAVGILILLIAIVNYMNLSTSHYSRRMKEVGVRKSAGAPRSSLILQFLTESLSITFLSLPLALVLVWLAVPYLNDFTSKSLAIDLFSNGLLWFFLVGMMLFVGVASGMYPAVLLSKISTIKALKGEQLMRASSWNFRSVLVTFQYIVVIGLIFSLLVIEGQLGFIRTSSPGYEKDQIVNLDLTRGLANLEVFRQELLKHPSIQSVAYSSRIPTGRLADSWGAAFNRGDSLSPVDFRLPFIVADEYYLTTLDIPLIAGENFSATQDMMADSLGYYVINRAAASALGFDSPEEIIGKNLSYGPYDGRTFGLGRILGVTENYHFESLHSEIAPMLMMKSSGRYREALIKVNAGNFDAALAHIEQTFAGFDAINTPNYRFLDELFNAQYQQEQRLSTMIKVFTSIAIFIGCLGLIGMVGFIIETRIKEIGIRKVLGATEPSILYLVAKRFFVLILVAFVIVSPIAFLLLNGWLDNFVYRISIGVTEILVPLVCTALITTAVTIIQTIKAAKINPVFCLKDE